jgi:hypothetical protein
MSPVPKLSSKRDAKKQSAQILTPVQSLEKNHSEQQKLRKDVVEHKQKREEGNDEDEELSEELQSSDDNQCIA